MTTNKRRIVILNIYEVVASRSSQVGLGLRPVPVALTRFDLCRIIELNPACYEFMAVNKTKECKVLFLNVTVDKAEEE